MNHEQLFLLTQTKDPEDTAEPAPGSTDPGLCTYPTHAGAAYQGTKRIPGMGARAGGRCDQPVLDGITRSVNLHFLRVTHVW